MTFQKQEIVVSTFDLKLGITVKSQGPPYWANVDQRRGQRDQSHPSKYLLAGSHHFKVDLQGEENHKKCLTLWDWELYQPYETEQREIQSINDDHSLPRHTRRLSHQGRCCALLGGLSGLFSQCSLEPSKRAMFHHVDNQTFAVISC